MMWKLLCFLGIPVFLAYYYRVQVPEEHVLSDDTGWYVTKQIVTLLFGGMFFISDNFGKDTWLTGFRTMVGNRPKELVWWQEDPMERPGIKRSVIEPAEADGKWYVVRFLPEKLEGKGPQKTLFYYHGGGMASGSPDMGGASFAAMKLGVQVFGIGYRLAPEHPFPAGLDDCVAGTKYMLRNRDEFQIGDYGLFGDSAGGYLATVIPMSIDFETEFGDKPKVSAPVVPMYQMLRFDTPSYQSVPNYIDLPRRWMMEFWVAYTGSPMYSCCTNNRLKDTRHWSESLLADKEFTSRADPLIWTDVDPATYERNEPKHDPNDFVGHVEKFIRNPLFNPGLADDDHLRMTCRNVEKMIIIVGEFCSLRDDGVMMAKRMAKAGCDNVELKVMDKVSHLFFHDSANALTDGYANAIEEVLKAMTF